MTHTCDVAIVGGGIGGLTLAISLARSRLDVQIYEQDIELREIGAGIAIGANATRLLEKLGVDLTPIANVPPTFEVRRWNDGELLWSHPIGNWYLQEMGAPFLTLHRSTLQYKLAAAVPSESIHLNHRLSALSEVSGGVRLQFDRGNDIVARVVVGADGVNSTVRRYVCGSVKPIYSGEIGFRGVIPTAKLRNLPTPSSLHIWCGPGTHAVFYGMDRGELVSLLAVYKPGGLPEWTRSHARAPATTDEALSIFERYGWDGRMLDMVRNIEGDMNLWALKDVPRVTRWSLGRVVILGDAAHAPLPHQGQGAGQAIEDAYALGEMLVGLDDYGATFDAFEQRRRGRTSRVKIYSRLAGRSYKLAGDQATKRDVDWPSLPLRIGWIHRHREEEAIRLR